MNYFFDTYAIIELINENINYQKFKDNIIITSVLNLVETHYILTISLSEREADYLINNINFSLIESDKETAVLASKFRFKNKKLKFSYADCLGYMLSLKNNFKFLTGDDAFKGFDNVEFVK